MHTFFMVKFEVRLVHPDVCASTVPEISNFPSEGATGTWSYLFLRHYV